MNEQRPLRPVSPIITQSLRQSRGDLAAGRVDSFDDYLAQLRQRIEARAAELDDEQARPIAGQ